MTFGPPVLVALWAGGITAGLIAMVGIAGELVRRRRAGGGGRPAGGNAGWLVGVFFFLAIPVALALPFAALGFAALAEVAAPPLVFLFVALAGLVCLRPALGAPDYGMQGCQKMFGVFAALYFAIWGLVAFWFVGGPARFATDAASLAWLKPPMAALPLALAITAMVGGKRTRWTFPTAFAVLAAIAALLYFPVEAGVAAAWLPASDWLRFPCAGFAVGLILASPWLLRIASLKGAARRNALRALPGQALLLAAPLALTGLAWAGTRAGIAAL